MCENFSALLQKIILRRKTMTKFKKLIAAVLSVVFAVTLTAGLAA